MNRTLVDLEESSFHGALMSRKRWQFGSESSMDVWERFPQDKVTPRARAHVYSPFSPLLPKLKFYEAKNFSPGAESFPAQLSSRFQRQSRSLIYDRNETVRSRARARVVKAPLNFRFRSEERSLFCYEPTAERRGIHSAGLKGLRFRVMLFVRNTTTTGRN